MSTSDLFSSIQSSLAGQGGCIRNLLLLADQVPPLRVDQKHRMRNLGCVQRKQDDPLAPLFSLFRSGPSTPARLIARENAPSHFGTNPRFSHVNKGFRRRTVY